MNYILTILFQKISVVKWKERVCNDTSAIRLCLDEGLQSLDVTILDIDRRITSQDVRSPRVL